jgi:chromosomal replication initiator protein
MFKEKDIWEKITIDVESDMPESETKAWFPQTNLKKLEFDLALIEVPNKFVANWLRDNYLPQIQDSFKKILNFAPEIRFTFDSLTRQHTQQYKTFDNGLIPSYTFDNFIASESNRFAYATALDVASKPVKNYNPLYIFSKTSLGKTHLLHAIGNHVLSINPLNRIKYMSADRFSSHLSNAARRQNINEFRQYYTNLDFLLIDDFQSLAGRERSLQEFTSIFNMLYQSKKQVVAAGKTSPHQTKNLPPDLRSRMEWGLLLELQVPDHMTRMKIIQDRAKEENLNILDDVAFFLANTTNDLKILIQYFVNLQTHTSLYQRKIDMSTVKSIIKHTSIYHKSVNDIQKLTAEYFNISISDLLSNKKSRDFSYPRQVCMYLCRKLTDLSFKDIGRAFGNKDHSTVIYAVNRVEKEKTKKQGVLNDINKIQKFLL